MSTRARIPKVRITRPGAAAQKPLERAGVTRGGSMTGLDHLDAAKTADDRNADKWVDGLSLTALKGIWEQFKRNYAHDRRDPAQRWTMARKAAVLRAICRLDSVDPNRQAR